MAQNNPATTIPTDNLVGKRMFVGNTTPAYPVTGDVWVDNSFATVGTQGTQGLQGIQGTTGTGTQGATGSTPTVWTSSAIAASTTLVARYQYFVTTSSAWTLTLPSSPTQGDEIRIFDASGSSATNNITVSPGSSNLHGSVQNFVMNVAYGSATLIYTGSTYGWKVA